ncbi:MAG: hypothetical protein KC912_09940 [Proteobacteria bacterium]|nr:hypothetical protein [Pseudomonadota bacterium]
MRSTAVLMLLALVACDSDGDGLSNGEEKKFGSSPDVADTDGDGLNDFEEFEAGTNPLLQDSDGDTYLDLWEVNEGTSPIDGNDRIYQGYWPYNPNKGAIAWGSGSAILGQPAPTYISGSDQFGDAVDLSDMMGAGKPVIIDISAQWCPPCQDTASWLAGRADSQTMAYFDGNYPGIRDAIAAGDIVWVTILAEDNYGAEPSTDVLHAWDTAYPNPAIPVLNDPAGGYVSRVPTNGFPTYHYIKGDGTVGYLNATNSQYQDFGALDGAMAEAGL